ncbi:MAG: hypothetical protein ABR985_00230 [Methanotrichaceae archaeon]|jgi:UDP-N-acetylglucosamine 2-epimerase
MVKSFGLVVISVDLMEPLGFLDFLQVEADARSILTDSRGS